MFQAVEQCVAVVLYSSVLGCLDTDGQLYLKLVMVRRKTIIGGSLQTEPNEMKSHKILFKCSLILLSIYQVSELCMLYNGSYSGADS